VRFQILALLMLTTGSGCTGGARLEITPGEEGVSPPAPPPAAETVDTTSQAGRVGDEATQNTGQVVADTDATANVSIDSAVGIGVIVLVLVVLAALAGTLGWMLLLLFGVLRLVATQSHQRALKRLANHRGAEAQRAEP